MKDNLLIADAIIERIQQIMRDQNNPAPEGVEEFVRLHTITKNQKLVQLQNKRRSFSL